MLSNVFSYWETLQWLSNLKNISTNSWLLPNIIIATTCISYCPFKMKYKNSLEGSNLILKHDIPKWLMKTKLFYGSQKVLTILCFI